MIHIYHNYYTIHLLKNQSIMWSVYMDIEHELYDAEYKKALCKKDAISTFSEDWVDCSESNLKVGDIVFVEYSPDSQKNLYTLCPEYGIIEEIKEITYESAIDNRLVKELSIIIVNHNGNLVDLNKNHLSIYSRGYYMNIKKYILNHPKTPILYDNSECLQCGKEHNSEDFL